MMLIKSLLCAASALTLATGAAFAGEMAQDSLETTDASYFAQSEYSAQSEPTMTDPITSANSGQMREYDVYYIVPIEVVEVEEVWLIPSGDSEMPHG
jgi:hypothetical protein